MSERTFKRFCPLEELPPGAKKARNLDGVPVLVCHTGEGIFAVSNLCSHQEKFLHAGRVRAGRITCPLHGAQFDLKTGAALCLPATRPIATYEVRVVDGWIEVCA
ncbi:MAG: bifunctional 3-phenylpropionate/cinnamic acid dioxygenase ferredoxin subunit [Porticoccaceae bacterium]|nr:MAG: bifunctional 3-phenylpropionate/cinnamic acid dioxygenase ferredoxin subunit [Porticoccaceae bacterium]